MKRNFLIKIFGVKKIRTIIAFQSALLVSVVICAFFGFFLVWNGLIYNNGANSLFYADLLYIKIPKFLVVSSIRPFTFMPLNILATLSGGLFGVFYGTLLTSIGAAISAVIVALIANILSKKYLYDWIASNIPSFISLLRRHEHKIIFMFRIIPFMHFDIFSIIFGICGMRLRSIFMYSLIGTLPESFIFSSIGNSREFNIVKFMEILTLWIILCFLPFLVYEWSIRKKGNSLINMLLTLINDLKREVLHFNRRPKDIEEIINNSKLRHNGSEDREVVIIIYGFFSTQRSIDSITKKFYKSGFDVYPLDLGGFLGVFNTRDIIELSEELNNFIEKLINEKGIKKDKINIIGHSKGGLVAIYWALKMNGFEKSKKIITLGSPFKGTWLAWLCSLTPLVWFWHDLWQMRSGSKFIKDLIYNNEHIKNIDIYTFASKNDCVSGKDGVLFFRKNNKNYIPDIVHPVIMNEENHFSFIESSKVFYNILRIIKNII